MVVNFSRYIFFLWYTFSTNAKVLKTNEDTIEIETSLKKLKLEKNRNIKLRFLFIKYVPVFFFFLLIISMYEIINMDIIIVLSPFYVILYHLFNNHKRLIVTISILSSIIIFYIYNILYFPIFIKYLLFSYVLGELFFDIFKNDQYYVYELSKNLNEPVAFAIKEKRRED